MNPSAANTVQSGSFGVAHRRSPAALVHTIEGEIIPRLLLAHGAGATGCRAPEPGHATHQDIEALAAMALETDAGEISASLAARRHAGVPLETIYLDIVAPAARLLGAWWDDDRCSFTDVTLGLCRLQQAVRELAEERISRSGPQDAAPRALFSPAPGEQHVLGLAMIEELFRKSGWRTDCAPLAAPKDVVRRVGESWHDLVGFTISTPDRCEALRRLVSDVRAASLNPKLCIMAGGVGLNGMTDPAAQLGVDAVAEDGRHAVLAAGRLLERHTSC
jgi:MerR family transcriptional regulator, light-induced transcriptional regulator